ncbi:hypothetical protein [Mesoterricola silvestris]|uniref:DUF948 domain-containing protein n=1 Tax=Mesoterricola silvestris TaxID=2927979 RepID=A0AA48KAP3_9BACT|nr:hypothetical protein [Mesoterricola silvestris]BDU74886.1 hypothetical protein METEAL_40600 [Mesoterricola silvestris]
MDRMLQFVLALVVLVLAGCLVPLLLQLYRTAKAVEDLAQSAREDLKQIAQDIHHTRASLDRVTGLVEKSLEFPATAGGLAVALVRSLTGLLDRGPSPWLEALLTAVKIGISFFTRPSADATEKETPHE